jgi:hypothetical protein
MSVMSIDRYGPSDQISPASIRNEARSFFKLFEAREHDLWVLSSGFITIMGSPERLSRDQIISKREKASKRLQKLNKRLSKVSAFEQKLLTSGYYSVIVSEVMDKVDSCGGLFVTTESLIAKIPDYKRNALVSVVAELVLDLCDGRGEFAKQVGEVRSISPSKKSVGLAKKLIQSLAQDGIALTQTANATINDLADGKFQANLFTPVRGPEFEVVRRLLIRSVTIKGRRSFRFKGEMNRFPARAINYLIKLFINGINTSERTIQRIQSKFPPKPGIELELKQYATHSNMTLGISKAERAKNDAGLAAWEASYLLTKDWIGFGLALQEMFADDDMWPYIKHVPKDPADIISSFFQALNHMFYDEELFPYPPVDEP